MSDFLIDLCFYLPAFIANAVPIIAKKVPFLQPLAKPIHHRLFGANKTWRGLLSGVLAAMTVMVIQAGFFSGLLPIELNTTTALMTGFLLGFGALAGDMAESLVKRRIGKKPGEPLFFWDGVDYILGAIVFAAVIYTPPLPHLLLLLVLAPLASLVANSIAYLLGWKNVWH